MSGELKGNTGSNQVVERKPLQWDLRSSVGDWDPKCTNAGPCRVASYGTRQPLSALTFDLSMRLGTWDSDLGNPCPQLAGECGGTWIASGRKGGPVGRGPIFTLDLAPCDDAAAAAPSPTSPTPPKVKIVPSVSKKLVLAYRDKESLSEEIIDLKRAVQDQQKHIRHHKIQASIVEMENRKMQRDIEDMEKPNCQSRSAKPQGTVRLRAKIQDLKQKIEGLQSKAEAQSDEINRLRTDARVTHTKEVEFERDVFAGEIARLTSLVNRLKQLCNHAASLENRDDTDAMKEKAKKLEDQNRKLEEEEEFQ
ncbi:uncharacterized protein [Physcomitrium patens]|uniref:uncharacterized protein isoform X2 n=1 Tax=Physcomitrium patens TaxID=3218 RepID=UPI003CCD97EF